ncbi:MAG: hypothetical protein DYG98_15670 [Haliscomenobacteraceae bacterium CHB4]|nr:hypothetical protein [Saprospiraceae bacterium]MCE7924484.1 hypothetical protein [Haliscomenobacteraceae bacterium CHB4]
MTKEQAKHVDSTELFRTLVRTEISSLMDYGAETKYNAATVDYFNKWSDVTADNVGAMWRKVHPGKKMENIGKTIESACTLVRNEVWVLLDYAQ